MMAVAAAESPSIRSRDWKATARSKCFWMTRERWSRAYFQVPELRGFEKFVQGRPVEEMPQITSRICGVCPMAHHMAATKALDAVYHVMPPPAAKKIRELFYSTFMVEDHALHFYFLGGPDFIVGPDAPAAERNMLGVIAKVGMEKAKKVIGMRRRLRELIGAGGGQAVHPVFGLPGGVAKHITLESRGDSRKSPQRPSISPVHASSCFDNVVLTKREYVDLIPSDAYTHRTYYMGMVDCENRVNFYDGAIRVVTPEGKEWRKFAAPENICQLIAEHVEPWSYAKFCYLKPLGWKGFVDGPENQPVQRGAAGSAERQRPHGDAARTGRAGTLFRGHGRQAGAPHAGQSLGAADRDAVRCRAHARTGWR